ncbi:hypothetical protein CGZ90_17125 [Fictibacillus aquaticus]|uniref:Uncharacterized protein n=1 Tax=Fictibacillus aquaticus TaxID=2021314 RepID=A0A235F618_9BACL|nr:hypothetical protein CGZ90_17125 [Fictibacillus aquaticus]
MNFREFLLKKHLLIKGERELKEISAGQYVNRLKSMRKNKIYNEEKYIDSYLEQKIQNRYKDWKTYLKTVSHYLVYKDYIK